MIEIKLTEIMNDRKISINKLSQQTGITRDTIREWRENRTKGIKFDKLEKICDALECEPGDLIKKIEDK